VKSKLDNIIRSIDFYIKISSYYKLLYKDGLYYKILSDT